MMLGEALAMARAKEEAAWGRTAYMAATIINHSFGHEGRAIQPQELLKGQSGISPKEFVAQMSGGLPTVKRGSPEHKALLCRT